MSFSVELLIDTDCDESQLSSDHGLKRDSHDAGALGAFHVRIATHIDSLLDDLLHKDGFFHILDHLLHDFLLDLPHDGPVDLNPLLDEDWPLDFHYPLYFDGLHGPFKPILDHRLDSFLDRGQPYC